MSQRVERENELALTLLRARVRHLEVQAHSPELVVPIEPRHFAHAFAVAVQDLELEGDVRLVVYKRFEQEALPQLGALFDGLNEMLSDAGVLPDLTRAQAVGARQTRARPVAPSPSPSAPAADAGRQRGRTPAPDDHGAGVRRSPRTRFRGL